MCRGPTFDATSLQFRSVVADAESRVGAISVRGRYHGSERTITDDYTVSRQVLGKGCSGSILLATSTTDNNRRFAVKSFNVASLKKIELDHLKGELATFLCMDHPHVGGLVDVYENKQTLKLVMECMDGGELLTRVTERKQFVEQDASDTMRQILLAVNYLHSHGIVHRDLKLENFLYDAEDGNHLKLIDFGFSKFFTKGRLKSTCGTLAYVAPEVLTESYTSQCDLWSVGVIAFILLSGTMPFFGNKKEKLENIARGNYKMRAGVWDPLSDASKDFVCSLLETDPAIRLNARGALAHPWIKEHHRSSVPIQPPLQILNALAAWKSAPKLQRACLKMMAWNLSQEEQAKFRDHFLALDVDHDGTISLEELRKGMRQCHISQAKVDQVFRSICCNDDDEIHYSEFLAALMSDQVADIQDGLLLATFRKFDKRNSGYISGEDFSTIVGGEYDGKNAREILLEADTIEQDGRIDYYEFKQYLRSCSGSSKGSNKASKVDALFAPRSVATKSGNFKVMDESMAEALTQKRLKRMQGKEKACCTLM